MTKMGCPGCRNADANAFDIPFTMAFQPILDIAQDRIWGYEALVRGKSGEGAGEVLAQVNEKNRYAFDQACRVTAIQLAGAKLDRASDAMLSINFMPNAVYEPKACIRATLAAASEAKFSPRRLMFEFTENEKMDDVEHVKRIVNEYKKMGFTTAIDDFGAGFAGLGLLAQFQTDLIKIDKELVRGIDKSPSRQAIISGILSISKLLKVKVLAECIETEAEARALYQAGVTLQQGYYFAKPEVETFVSKTDIPAIADGFPLSSTKAVA
ncbi:MAG: EAL domain-containing protein [Hyphomicrobiales bacterium]|jgi:EAL domain-containing protein (putative c-di-GMP-specific phosphodiesterase class I)